LARLRFLPDIALSPTSCAGEHERRTSMTALQDWLSDRPMDPRNLKGLIWDAIRGLSVDEPQSLPEHTLMGRGLERC
jgi:hypothetical protein